MRSSFTTWSAGWDRTGLFPPPGTGQIPSRAREKARGIRRDTRTYAGFTVPPRSALGVQTRFPASLIVNPSGPPTKKSENPCGVLVEGRSN